MAFFVVLDFNEKCKFIADKGVGGWSKSIVEPSFRTARNPVNVKTVNMR